MAIKPIEILIRAKDEASSVFDLFKRNAAGVGAAIAGYFGFNAFAGAVKGAADLEAALSEVAAVSGAGAGEMGKLRAAAEEAGAATKYTATEAAVALGNLARAGLDSNQAIAALKPTLQLAQAGSIDLGQAAEITTKTIAGFGLAATDAGRIADVLAKGANASNTSVRGLGEAMSYAAPMAKTVGLDLESTVAIMGKFADGGIDASRAGTALNSILSQFADPSSKFKAALSDAGITTLDFNKALVQLAAKGKDGEKAMLAVGTEAGPALRSLLNQGIPALNELRAKLADAGGSAEATAKIMGDNLKGAIDGLSSAWDAVKVKLATPVLPVLKSAVDQVSASLKAAVDGGLIGKFGDALANGFRAGIDWATQFLQKVDFDKIATDAKAAADKVGAAFESIRASAATAGGVFDAVFGTLTAGFNALLVPIYKWGEGFATVQQGILNGVAAVAERLSQITFGSVSADFKAAAAQIKSEADAAGAVAQSMGVKAVDALTGMTNGAEQARNGFAALTGTADTTTTSVNGVAASAKGAAADLEAMGSKGEAAGVKASAAAKEQAANLEVARAKVAELRAEYEKALGSGDASKQIDALQKLEHATNAATAAARALNNENDAAKEKASAIAAAFAGMGIKTKAELQTLADTAKARFDLIKASGQATTEGLAAAWKQAAQAAIDANNGVAPSWVQAQAAAKGYRVETDGVTSSLVSLRGAATGAAGGVNDLAAAQRAGIAAAQAYAQSQTDAGAAARAAQMSNDELQQSLSGDKYGNRPGGLAERNAAIGEDSKRRDADRGKTTGTFDAFNNASSVEELDRKYETALNNLNQSVRDNPSAMGSGWSDWALQNLQKQYNASRAEMSRKRDASANAERVATRSDLNPYAGTTKQSAVAQTYNVQVGNRKIETTSAASARSLIAALKEAQMSA